jgi:predicted nucleotidyltransferase
MLSEDNTRRYTEPPQLDEAGLVAFLATQEDIVAAYLFGSLAQGRATPRSDLDIAVLLRRIPDPQSDDLFPQFRLMDELRRFADREVDVVILNTAPPVLKDQVLRHGRRIFERDRQARVEFEVRTGQEYADLKPMYDFFNRDLFAKIKEVGLVGRRRAHRTPQAAGALRG